MKTTAEHWIVFGTGRRCRVSLWPEVSYTAGRNRDSLATAGFRYLVFQSPGEMGCVPVPPSLDLDALGPDEVLSLYARARRIAPALS